MQVDHSLPGRDVRWCFSSRFFQQSPGLRVSRIQGLGPFEQGSCGSEVLVLVNPEAGQFPESVCALSGLLRWNGSNGVAETVLCAGPVPSLAESPCVFDLEVGVEHIPGGGVP